MIDYKEYQQALKIKEQYEAERKEIQSERFKRKEMFSFDTMPEDWAGQLKYLIQSLSLQIAKERDLIKRSMFIDRARHDKWLAKNLNAKLDKLISDRNERRKQLFDEIKNQKGLDS